MPDIQYTTDAQIEAMREELRKARRSGKLNEIVLSDLSFEFIQVKKNKFFFQIISIVAISLIIITLLVFFIIKVF